MRARVRRIPSAGNQRGTMTIFVLGIAVAVLFLGGLSVDFWRAISARRELAAMADASATAGANGIDQQSLRAGNARLDDALASQLAQQQLADQSANVRIQNVTIDANQQRVVVTLTQHLDFSLLAMFGDHTGFTVTASAAASPTRVP